LALAPRPRSGGLSLYEALEGLTKPVQSLSKGSHLKRVGERVCGGG
jgi:hypothetical protein